MTGQHDTERQPAGQQTMTATGAQAAGGGGRHTSTPPPADTAGTADTAVIKTEIEQTRAELGDTMAALGTKTDVKTRACDAAASAKGWIDDKLTTGTQVTRRRAQQAAGKAPQAKHWAAQAARAVRERPVPAVLAAAAVLLVVVGRRRRNR
ncbi:MAG: hypothetical protein QOD41_2764 [Cryptosporangiaceae bacterium]|jgi:hypothetical protein|nr:hypothetical protein [Cryptosporangiaceae bacterium]